MIPQEAAGHKLFGFAKFHISVIYENINLFFFSKKCVNKWLFKYKGLKFRLIFFNLNDICLAQNKMSQPTQPTVSTGEAEFWENALLVY